MVTRREAPDVVGGEALVTYPGSGDSGGQRYRLKGGDGDLNPIA